MLRDVLRLLETSGALSWLRAEHIRNFPDQSGRRQGEQTSITEE
jgi:hypothetical protein